MAPITGLRGGDGSGLSEEQTAAQWRQWAVSRRRLLGASGFGAGALLLGGRLAGSAGAAAQEASPAAAAGEPVMGGSLSMSLADDDVLSFDPVPVFDNMSIWTMLLIYDQLIRVGPDGTSLEPGLATEWSASDDGLTYTFTLREAAFHDGTPCTAEDVAFCLNRVAFEEGSPWAFIFSAVESVEASAPDTVVVTLSSVWVPFEADMALFGASIYPQAAFEAQGEDLWQAPIGTGPFAFASWDKGAQIVLTKNPAYWDAPKPYLDELVFKVLTDANARMLQFQGGELDIATSVPFSQIEQIRANPDFVLVEDAVARFDYMGFNLTRQPFDDLNLRRAINYAVDKESIIQNVLFGAGVPATSYLPLMPGHDPDSPGYPFDLEEARRLVAESAYADGFAYELLIGTGDPVDAQIAQLIAAQLAEIGGTVTVTQLEPAAVTERLTVSNDYDSSKTYYTTDIVDPDELTSFAVLSDGGTDAVWTFYQNDEVDTLIREAQVETDPAARQALYDEVQRLHLEDAPMIFLFYPTGRTATQSYVQNFRILPTGNYRLYETWRDDA